MLTDVAWFVLHGGGGHNESGAVSFEAALGGLVSLLVVLGVLWYLGVFESLSAAAEDPESGTRD